MILVFFSHFLVDLLMCLESLYDVILEKVYLSDIRPHINSGGVHGLIELAEMSTSGKIGNSLDCSM